MVFLKEQIKVERLIYIYITVHYQTVSFDRFTVL